VSLSKLIVDSVAMANELTGDLQVTVQHEAVQFNDDGTVLEDGHGNPTFDDAVDISVLLESEFRLIRTEAGQEAMSMAKLTILEPMSVHVRDRFTLPDGRSGPILRIKGLNAGSAVPALTELWLGS
jgi:hypothetical protein